MILPALTIASNVLAIGLPAATFAWIRFRKIEGRRSATVMMVFATLAPAAWLAAHVNEPFIAAPVVTALVGIAFITGGALTPIVYVIGADIRYNAELDRQLEAITGDDRPHHPWAATQKAGAER